MISHNCRICFVPNHEMFSIDISNFRCSNGSLKKVHCSKKRGLNVMTAVRFCGVMFTYPMRNVSVYLHSTSNSECKFALWFVFKFYMRFWSATTSTHLTNFDHIILLCIGRYQWWLLLLLNAAVKKKQPRLNGTPFDCVKLVGQHKNPLPPPNPQKWRTDLLFGVCGHYSLIRWFWPHIFYLSRRKTHHQFTLSTLVFAGSLTTVQRSG